jgi:REP element-mobilizing transposase RayT
VVHFSVQRDHLHLIVEASDRRALSRGMQGLSIRVARAANGELGRKGRVFATATMRAR